MGIFARGNRLWARYKDEKGQWVNERTGYAVGQEDKAERYFAEAWTQPAAKVSADAGAHRFVWNLRWPRPKAVEYSYSIAAVLGEDTPLAPEGAMALPGDYDVALIVELEQALMKLSDAISARSPTYLCGSGRATGCHRRP